MSGGAGQHGFESHRHGQAAHPEPLLLPDQPAGEPTPILLLVSEACWSHHGITQV